MNSKKCKLLRKMIYGDLSLKMRRQYVTIGHQMSTVVEGKIVKYISNETRNAPESPRAKYLIAKKLYKKRRQNN